jgi:hypothetical protein
MMRLGWIIAFLWLAAHSYADVSVSATVDRAHIGFGESVTLTIAVQGAQNSAQPDIPAVDGLSFNGPSANTSISIVNGQMSQSVSYSYQVVPAHMGQFTIPAVLVNVGGKGYLTRPIHLTVDKAGAQTELQDSLYAKVQIPSQRIYLGQSVPVNVVLYARQNLPLRGVGGYSAEAEGLGYNYLPSLKTANQEVNGEGYNLYAIEGAISPERIGKLNFGPCVLKAQLISHRRNQIEEFMNGPEVHEVPVSVEAVPIEVLPLPTEGRPADFTGAIGQWHVEVTAKPTEVSVGDPITVTVKVAGNGNIETVPPVQLKGLEGFKTYDPTTKTTKNDLNTTGERVFQQVLVPKDATVTHLPEVRLSYFDPVANAYKTAGQNALPIKVKPSANGQIAVLTGSPRARPAENLGQDLVYLKGDPGPDPGAPLVGTPIFWTLNVVPILGLAGALAWKRRRDRLAGDIAYARRSRAARNARRILTEKSDHEHIQRALQEYLGDRLNIPSSGMTASVVEEQLKPHGVPEALTAEVQKIFEACDAARFSGAAADTGAWQQAVERLIDELEKINL